MFQREASKKLKSNFGVPFNCQAFPVLSPHPSRKGAVRIVSHPFLNRNVYMALGTCHNCSAGASKVRPSHPCFTTPHLAHGSASLRSKFRTAYRGEPPKAGHLEGKVRLGHVSPAPETPKNPTITHLYLVAPSHPLSFSDF